jgi:antibiotic biosynthesis monooxygenase (ABM) superfamily enzyme
MSFVRTASFTVPPDRTQELNPGHNLYLAAVHGTQIAAQNVPGYHRGGSWMQRQADGSIRVVMYAQFAELDSLEEYSNVPMVRDFVVDVTKYLSPVVIEIYEVLG